MGAAAAGASWQISLAHSPPQCPQEITTKSSLSFDVAVKLKSLGGASGGANCDLLAFALFLSLSLSLSLSLCCKLPPLPLFAKKRAGRRSQRGGGKR
jgi:hypothetical protein